MGAQASKAIVSACLLSMVFLLFIIPKGKTFDPIISRLAENSVVQTDQADKAIGMCCET
jgi:hypothetical protein